MREFSGKHGYNLVVMETNALRSFPHTPSTFSPSLVPVGPETAEKKSVEQTANSNYSKIYGQNVQKPSRLGVKGWGRGVLIGDGVEFYGIRNSETNVFSVS